MLIRVDRRTPLPIIMEIMDFPVVTEYKYLGLLIDDAMKFDMENNRKKEAAK